MKKLKRILDLIRKTGDRYIFEDDQGNGFVILNIDDYENLVLKNSRVKDLSEEELLNKINKDIALWKTSQEEDKLDAEISELKEEAAEDQYYFEPVEDEE